MKKKVKGEQVERKTVRGIELDKVDEATLDAKLEELELEQPESLPEKVKVYLEWTDSQIKLIKKTGGQFGQCEACDAPCELSWPLCPVCGTHYDDDAQEPPKADTEEEQAVLESDLDAGVDRVKTLVKEELVNYHRLGRALYDIFNNKLYKARKDEDGKPLYRSWDDFVESEIEIIGGRRARVLMDVATEFTEEQVVTLGVEKLRIVSRFNDEDRKKLLEKAPTLSTRALAAAAAEVMPATPPPPAEDGAGAYADTVTKTAGLRLGTEAAKKKRDELKTLEAEKEAGGITAVFQMGKYALELYKTGKTWTAKMPLVNDTAATFEVNMNKNPPELVFIVERQKD